MNIQIQKNILKQYILNKKLETILPILFYIQKNVQIKYGFIIKIYNCVYNNVVKKKIL